MFGQGSPIIWTLFQGVIAILIRSARAPAPLIIALSLLSCLPTHLTVVCAAEKTVRLRLAWGSNDTNKSRWTGQIQIEGAELTELQPLGIETDASVALRIEGSRIVVQPQEYRGFDGCDVTVRADEEALVQVDLASESLTQAQGITVPISLMASGQVREALNDTGSFFIAHRAPGDRLRVETDRKHFVFDPGEIWSFSLRPDLQADLSKGPIRIELELRSNRKSEVLWQASRQIVTGLAEEEELQFELPCPETEDAYSLVVTARHQEGFATKWVPGVQSKVIDSRQVDLVVINPASPVPQVGDSWEQVLTIDPAQPKWWQRLPSWTSVAGLRERLSGSIGNIRPLVRPFPTGPIVELPAHGDSEPYWQSYTLPVRDPGQLHMVEIEYPIATEQHLSISIVEPDAAGRVNGIKNDVGFSSVGVKVGTEGRTEIHRFVFWPRTASPQLLLVNQHETAVAQFGKITLLRQNATSSMADSHLLKKRTGRLVAGYIASPDLATNFGAPEVFDSGSGLSVQSWATYLTSAQRLVQYLRLNGQNAVFLSVAADGSALYPSDLLQPSPRYDTGILAASGQDPLRKDILEMLLRVLDREGIDVIPTVQLATPIPRLEGLRRATDSRESGIEWISYEGNTWLEKHGTTQGKAPHYNVLNGQVREEVARVIHEILERYGHHKSLAGVGIQLEGMGYGVLPDSAWGFDDATIQQFQVETGIKVQGEGIDRFRQRALQLAGEQAELWMNWRTQRLKAFYNDIGASVQASRLDRKLFLTTERLFTGSTLTQKVRQSLSIPENLRQALYQQGIDLARLQAHPGVTVLAPIRISSTDKLQACACDLRVNTASKRNELFGSVQHEGQLFFQDVHNKRIPSFEQMSPYGSEKTHLVLGRQALPVGDFQRQHLVTQLASQDASNIVVGGPCVSLSTHSELQGVLKTIQQLPSPDTIVRTLSKQPVLVRVYRSQEGTTVAVLNQSPWPMQIRMPVETSEQVGWVGLGNLASGSLNPGSQDWEIQLEPYDVRAWQFNTEKVQVRDLSIAVDERVREDLLQRIEQIEARTRNLDVRRSYAHLDNSSFEVYDEMHRIEGWQPWLLGASGTVALSDENAHSGRMSMRMRSDDLEGVVLQSHSFSMPETGQLFVTVHLRAEKWEKDARLQMSVEDSNNGEVYRRYAILGNGEPLSKEWAPYELPLNDVPFNREGQLRIQFQLQGQAEVFLDDVQLCDLRFDEGLRGSLVKRIFTARLALDNNHVVDCLQVMDDYWSRHLVEYVPPRGFERRRVASQPETPQEDSKNKEESAGSRLRDWVPRIWR